MTRRYWEMLGYYVACREWCGMGRVDSLVSTLWKGWRD